MSDPAVRDARARDLGAVAEIYAHYVRTTPITFDLDPPQLADWEAAYRAEITDGPYVFLVGVDGRDRVLGYARTTEFKRKKAYQTSLQTSIYCARDATGRGIGSLLYEELLARLKDGPFHRAYAGITLPNAASVRLHERFGFEHRGTFREVGYKLARYWDVAQYEKALD